MLLYLVKHSRPDIANGVRELSKVLDGPSLGDYKELLRTIKFVIDTKTKGLKIFPELEGDIWILKLFSDSNFAGDKNTRKSVTGFILYLCNVPIAWKSKSQKCVSLSLTESKYYACSEAVKELLFVIQLLKEFNVKVKKPVIVKVDNIGAICLAETRGISDRTKHIDTRYHFLRNLLDDVIKIEFVKSEDNDADTMTKNINERTYETHEGKYMIDEKDLND